MSPTDRLACDLQQQSDMKAGIARDLYARRAWAATLYMQGESYRVAAASRLLRGVE